MSDNEELEGIGPGGAYEPESHDGKDWKLPFFTIVGIVGILAILFR